MTDTNVVEPSRRRFLPHDGDELPGAPAPDAANPENAESLVHQLVTEQRRELKAGVLPDLAPADAAPASPVRHANGQTSRKAAMISDWLDESHANEDPERLVEDMILQAEDIDTEQPRQKKARMQVRLPALRLPVPKMPELRKRRTGSARRPLLSGVKRLPIPAAVRGYRPTRKHVLLAVLALIVLMRPVLVGLIVLVLFWVVLIAYLTVGPDRWGEILSGAWMRLAEKRPELAERIRQRADAFAIRFDSFLDWLPESWADRLALPDFSQLPGPGQDDDRPDPFDRLAAEARQV